VSNLAFTSLICSFDSTNKTLPDNGEVPVSEVISDSVPQLVATSLYHERRPKWRFS